MDFFKKAQNFLKNAQNLLIHPEDSKSQNQFFPFKMGQNTCKKFQKWIFSKNAQNFQENAQNLLIRPEDSKSQNQFFPFKMGQNTSKIEFFKNAQSSDLTRKFLSANSS